MVVNRIKSNEASAFFFVSIRGSFGANSALAKLSSAIK